jgi:hypothetical protein
MAGIISNEFPSLMKEFPVWPVHPLIGSFAGAAEDVGLSPSAAAKLITRLEQRVCTENPIRIDCVTESPKRQRR